MVTRKRKNSYDDDRGTNGSTRTRTRGKAKFVQEDLEITNPNTSEEGKREEGHKVSIDDDSFIQADVMVRILSFVPMKSIGMFRCVCNSWKELLSSPFFARIHALAYPLPPFPSTLITMSDRFYSLNSSDLKSNCRVPLIELPSQSLVAQEVYSLVKVCLRSSVSSHGLVCFTTSNAGSNTLFLYNPTTQRTHYPPKPLWPYKVEGPLTNSKQPLSILYDTFLCVSGACYGMFIDVHDRCSVEIFLFEEDVWGSVALPLEVEENLKLPFETKEQVRRQHSCKLVGWGERVCLVHAFGKGKLGIWSLSDEKRWEKVILKEDLGSFKFRPTDCSYGNCHKAQMNVILHQHTLLVCKRKRTYADIYMHRDFMKKSGREKFKWPYGNRGDPFINIIPYNPSLYSFKYLGCH
ncbi:hypothetical protein AMTR_s00045p00159230 [Amborella trichopoda]|uniref:F-box domain-containing protein n=1 Tax=Amborella trichopoda TaxID=13333 RepID=W1P2F4_AMBTC|nr:hypothetical protein AMTR_s00045p00159230 [Amborella trichopoda]